MCIALFSALDTDYVQLDDIFTHNCDLAAYK